MLIIILVLWWFFVVFFVCLLVVPPPFIYLFFLLCGQALDDSHLAYLARNNNKVTKSEHKSKHIYTNKGQFEDEKKRSIISCSPFLVMWHMFTGSTLYVRCSSSWSRSHRSWTYVFFSLFWLRFCKVFSN